MTKNHASNLIVSQVSIVELISDTVELKQKGSEHTGLCPFHGEKTPSFTVNDAKGFYYCFGCQAKGNVITFVMQTRNMTFPHALEYLSERFKITLPSLERQKQLAAKYKVQHQLLRTLTIAAKRDLRTFEPALTYVKQRGLDAETVKMYHLGYAGRIYHQTINECIGQEKQALIEHGIIRENGKSKFAGRLLFPIQDTQGRVIAFGSRTLDPDTKPKYINSPETPLFKKRETLYGLKQLKQTNTDTVFITEGYMDCIALHSHGIPPVVACLGTAFTEQHWLILRKYAKRFIFCFDGDEAGTKASWTSLIQILPHLTGQVEVKFIQLPKNEDPDSFVRNYGHSKLIQLCDQAPTWDEFYFDQLSLRTGTTSISNKANFLQTGQQQIQTIKNESLRAIMQHQLSELLALPSHPEIKKDPQVNQDHTNEKHNLVPSSDNCEPIARQLVGQLISKDSTPLLIEFKLCPHEGGQYLNCLYQMLKYLTEHPNADGQDLHQLFRGSEHYQSLVEAKKEFHTNRFLIQLAKLNQSIYQIQIQQLRTQKSHTDGERRLLKSLIERKGKMQQIISRQLTQH